jgi:hypothetical protein
MSGSLIDQFVEKSRSAIASSFSLSQWAVRRSPLRNQVPGDVLQWSPAGRDMRPF